MTEKASGGRRLLNTPHLSRTPLGRPLRALHEHKDVYMFFDAFEDVVNHPDVQNLTHGRIEAAEDRLLDIHDVLASVCRQIIDEANDYQMASCDEGEDRSQVYDSALDEPFEDPYTFLHLGQYRHICEFLREIGVGIGELENDLDDVAKLYEQCLDLKQARFGIVT